MRLIRSVNSEVFEVDFGDFLLQVPIFFNGSTKFWRFDRDLIRSLFVFSSQLECDFVYWRCKKILSFESLNFALVQFYPFAFP